MKPNSKPLLSASLIAAIAAVSAPAFAQPDTTSPPAPAAPAPPPASGPAAPSATLTVEAPSNETPITKDQSQGQTIEGEKKESTLPWRNSALLFDQSMSTQTAHLDTSPQLSYVPLYEWWLSFRPRYYFSEKVFVSARFDYYKEFTNSAQTTKYREDVFGDIWTNVVYDTKVPAISKNTKASVGARFLFPTSKDSQDGGVYVQAGVTAGAKQAITLNGDSAKFLNDLTLSVGGWYNHPFTRATTPTNPSLDYVRQNTEGRSFLSDQLRGSTMTNHQLTTSVGAKLAVTPKVSLGLDMILINVWKYNVPKDNGGVATLTGPVRPAGSPNDTNHLVNTWFVASVDYDLFDELSLGLGYYNLANELAPDGQLRGVFTKENIWWSPDARVFFDVTANLDKIFELASGRKSSKANASAPRPSALHMQNAL